ncbi:hypothetical protein KSS87_015064 [Heliosperma pusillum]|nr:hypothetical protein KSS87_015064 [Heliosperma pusillum]
MSLGKDHLVLTLEESDIEFTGLNSEFDENLMQRGRAFRVNITAKMKEGYLNIIGRIRLRNLIKIHGYFAAVVGGRSSSSSGKGKGHQCAAKYGFILVKGKANHPMEDFHVAKFAHARGHELGLFAIYDGHLGDTVPAYLQKHLFANILKEDDFWSDPNRSILKAYEGTDQAILNHNPDLGRGGSTAVTAILVDGKKLWVANVGDSRAVLSRNGQAVQMSTDHEPNTERGSIEDRGGFVSNMPGDVARVNGQLAVSRAFGDKNLKNHLRSDPDIKTADINVETDLMILASDGLWKVMSNQEAVDIARSIKDPVKGAKQLATEALNRDSKDDISCIVVQLVRIQMRVPEFGWTTQKIFHLMNVLVNGLRAILFGLYKLVFQIRPHALEVILLDLPGLLFFSTYTLLVLFWAEIYHQARSLPTDTLRPIYYSVNGIVYFIQIIIWLCMRIGRGHAALEAARLFFAGAAFSAFDEDVDVDVMDHPIANLLYYMVVEIIPSGLVLFILRKLPPKRVSDQYHAIE